MTSPGPGGGRGVHNLLGATPRQIPIVNPVGINYMDFIPVFAGEDDKGVSVLEFFNIFNEIAGEAGWTPMISRHVRKAKLSGPALKFYLTNPRIQVMRDMGSIKRVMVSHFNKGFSDHSLMWKFLNSAQLKGEAVRDYAMRLEKLRDSINSPGSDWNDSHVGDQTLFRVFHDGLNQDILDRIISLDITDYESCLEVAERIEGKLVRRNHRQKNVLLMDRDDEGAKSEGACRCQGGPKDRLQDHDEGDSEVGIDDQMERLSLRRDLMGGRSQESISAPTGHMRSNLTMSKAHKTLGENIAIVKVDTDKRVTATRPRFFNTSHKTDKYRDTTRKGMKLLVDIMVGKTKLRSLLDSASDISLISESGIKSINLGKHVYVGDPVKVYGTNHAVIDSRRYLDLRFRYVDQNDIFCHTFCIVPRDKILGYDIIMGGDYIIASGGVMDLEKGIMRLHGQIDIPIERVMNSECSSVMLVVTPGEPHHEEDIETGGIDQKPTIPRSNNVVIGPAVHKKDEKRWKPPQDMMGQPKYINGSVKAVKNFAEKFGPKREPILDRQSKKDHLLWLLAEKAEGPGEVKKRIHSIIQKFPHVFALDSREIGLIKGWEHDVEVTKEEPIVVKQFTIAESLKGELATKLKEYLEADIIEPSTSAWNLPKFVKTKHNGGVRLVLDAQKVNAITRRVDYPMTDIKSILAKLGGCQYFSKLDLESGYHQVGLGKGSRELFAFRTPWGKFHFKRLPMGATNSGLYFQKVMEDILSDVTEEGVYIFQDDVLIATDGIDQHLEILERVLEAFGNRGVTMKLEKCELMREVVMFLGHRVTQGEFAMSTENISSILKAKRPHNKTTVRRFLGKLRFYARFVPDLTEMINDIQVLLKGRGEKIHWTEGASASFERVKEYMSKSPILRYPDYTKPFRLSVTHNETSIASTLEQSEDDGVVPLGYFSRTLKGAEENYPSIEKDALAIVDSLNHFGYIIYGFPTTISSGHNALEYLRSLKEGNSRITKWVTRMLDNSPEFVKSSVDSDIINKVILEGESGPDEADRSKSDVTKLGVPIVYTDGSCSKNGKEGAKAGIGCYVDIDGGIEISRGMDGKQSNNRAELLAAIEALEMAINKGWPEVIIRTDSRYMIENVKTNMDRWKQNGWVNYRGKQISNGEDFKRISYLLEKVKVTWEYIKAHSGDRGNEVANSLAIQGSNVTPVDPAVTTLTKVAIAEMGGGPKGIVVTAVTKSRDSQNLNGLKGTVDHRSVTADHKSVCAIRTAATVGGQSLTKQRIREEQARDDECITISAEIEGVTVGNWDSQGIKLYKDPEGIIYARGIVGMTKQEQIKIDSIYIPKAIRQIFIREEHESKWATHPQYQQLCRAILSKYFWPTFRSDIRRFTETCDACQKMRETRKRSVILDFEKPSIPWQMIAVDVVGPIIKTASGNEFILSIIDIFSRFISLVPIPDQSKETILRAIEVNYIARFGCPQTILTDNGTNFCSGLFGAMCKILGVQHKRSPPWHPQTNGTIERSNRELKKKLTLLCNNASNRWDEKIHMVEFAMNNSYHSSTGTSPSELLYGRKMKSPINNSLKDSEEEYIMTMPYIEGFKSRLEVIRMTAFDWEKGVRGKRNESKNRNRKLPNYKIGEEVLYKRVKYGGNRKTGFSFAYDGPFVITDKVSEVTYRFHDGDHHNNRVITAHADRLKSYMRKPGGDQENTTTKSTSSDEEYCKDGQDMGEASHGHDNDCVRSQLEVPVSVCLTRDDGSTQEKESPIDPHEARLVAADVDGGMCIETSQVGGTQEEEVTNEAIEINQVIEKESVNAEEVADQGDGILGKEGNERMGEHVQGHFTRSKGKMGNIDYSSIRFDRAGRINISNNKKVGV